MAVHLNALLQKTRLLHPHAVEDKTCPVCREDYLQAPSREFPRKLPCGHILGTECLLAWACHQAHAGSLLCPYCRQTIIKSGEAEHSETTMGVFMVAKIKRILNQVIRTLDAVIKVVFEDYRDLTDLIILTDAMIMLVFLDDIDISWASKFWQPVFRVWRPMFLIGFVLQPRIKAHPRYGLVLMVLGLYVGALIDPRVGLTLLEIAIAPFNAVISTWVSANHMWWRALGASLVVLAVLTFIVRPDWEMIRNEAGWQSVVIAVRVISDERLLGI